MMRLILQLKFHLIFIIMFIQQLVVIISDKLTHIPGNNHGEGF